MRNRNNKRNKALRKYDGVIVNTCNCQYPIIPTVIQSLGWTSTKSDSRNWDIAWSDRSRGVDDLVRKSMYFQKMNHFPGMNEIYTKSNLAKTLQRMQFINKEEYSFFPLTWELPKCYSDVAKYYTTNGTNACLIIKPKSGAKGEGIYLSRTIDSIHREYEYIAQEYIPNPLLIDGFKFDLRIYALIISSNPLRIFIYKDGLVRLCTEPYQVPTDDNIECTYMHLTNYALNKDNENFVPNDLQNENQSSKRSLTWFWTWLKMNHHHHHHHHHRENSNMNSNIDDNSNIKNNNIIPITYHDDKNTNINNFNNVNNNNYNNNNEKENDICSTLWTSISDIIIKTLIAVQPVLSESVANARVHSTNKNPFTCFELLGFDILLTTELKPYLLEVNHSPSFHCDSILDYNTKFHLIQDTLKLLNINHDEKKLFLKKSLEKTQDRLYGDTSSTTSSSSSSPRSSSSSSSFFGSKDHNQDDIDIITNGNTINTATTINTTTTNTGNNNNSHNNTNNINNNTNNSHNNSNATTNNTYSQYISWHEYFKKLTSLYSWKQHLLSEPANLATSRYELIYPCNAYPNQPSLGVGQQEKYDLLIRQTHQQYNDKRQSPRSGSSQGSSNRGLGLYFPLVLVHPTPKLDESDNCHVNINSNKNSNKNKSNNNSRSNNDVHDSSNSIHNIANNNHNNVHNNFNNCNATTTTTTTTTTTRTTTSTNANTNINSTTTNNNDNTISTTDNLANTIISSMNHMKLNGLVPLQADDDDDDDTNNYTSRNTEKLLSNEMATILETRLPNVGNEIVKTKTMSPDRVNNNHHHHHINTINNGSNNNNNDDIYNHNLMKLNFPNALKPQYNSSSSSSSQLLSSDETLFKAFVGGHDDISSSSLLSSAFLSSTYLIPSPPVDVESNTGCPTSSSSSPSRGNKFLMAQQVYHENQLSLRQQQSQKLTSSSADKQLSLRQQQSQKSTSSSADNQLSLQQQQSQKPTSSSAANQLSLHQQQSQKPTSSSADNQLSLRQQQSQLTDSRADNQQNRHHHIRRTGFSLPIHNLQFHQQSLHPNITSVTTTTTTTSTTTTTVSDENIDEIAVVKSSLPSTLQLDLKTYCHEYSKNKMKNKLDVQNKNHITSASARS